MKYTRQAFTLVELLVVVLIIGILATMGVPYYVKTVESSKASDALAVAHMIAIQHRMYKVDHPGVSLSGTISNTCNSADCDSASSACKLVACNYVSQMDWDKAAYAFALGSGSTAASARRKTSGASGTTTSPYRGWGYDFNTSGTCQEVGGAPSCPSF